MTAVRSASDGNAKKNLNSDGFVGRCGGASRNSSNLFETEDGLPTIRVNNYSCHIPPLSMPTGSNGLSRMIHEPEHEDRTADTWHASATSAET
jgi:hypothetical protein